MSTVMNTLLDFLTLEKLSIQSKQRRIDRIAPNSVPPVPRRFLQAERHIEKRVDLLALLYKNVISGGSRTS